MKKSRIFVIIGIVALLGAGYYFAGGGGLFKGYIGAEEESALQVYQELVEETEVELAAAQQNLQVLEEEAQKAKQFYTDAKDNADKAEKEMTAKSSELEAAKKDSSASDSKSTEKITRETSKDTKIESKDSKISKSTKEEKIEPKIDLTKLEKEYNLAKENYEIAQKKVNEAKGEMEVAEQAVNTARAEVARLEDQLRVYQAQVDVLLLQAEQDEPVYAGQEVVVVTPDSEVVENEVNVPNEESDQEELVDESVEIDPEELVTDLAVNFDEFNPLEDDYDKMPEISFTLTEEVTYSVLIYPPANPGSPFGNEYGNEPMRSLASVKRGSQGEEVSIVWDGRTDDDVNAWYYAPDGRYKIEVQAYKAIVVQDEEDVEQEENVDIEEDEGDEEISIITIEDFDEVYVDVRVEDLLTNVDLSKETLDIGKGETVDVSFDLPISGSYTATVYDPGINMLTPLIVLKDDASAGNGINTFSWNGIKENGQFVTEGEYVIQIDVEILGHARYRDSKNVSISVVDSEANKSNVVEACSDSEDEVDYFSEGILLFGEGINSYIYPNGLEDACYGAEYEGSTEYVMDYYCTDGGNYNVQWVNCESYGSNYVCENGACVAR